MINSRLKLKEKLLSTIKNTAIKIDVNPEYPITDTMINPREAQTIDELTKNLETLNPFPNPLQFATNLLDGIWQLQYSSAREIRSLNKLPLGFKLRKVYQIINVQEVSFFNIAFVEHSSKMINGYVKVTASFTPKIESTQILPTDTINVNFEKRYVSIQKIAGFKTPMLDPVKTFDARNPQGRIPSLTISYIDENLRIGRGGDGSLFILTSVRDLSAW
ncbi:fimbrial protein [Cyanobacterium stanieri LEGE 03274]|uniref:Fimbrial protein n=1 Tax=Cyanobacterium stanieri LEGE 03274 TaxID=1828756 RepID=A0ABR9V0E3_9CHRO|nr:PAP/fibrillin family protein [Cyanobacterium stanieri]MBE9221350.1 fimbrial protein [Cyanobacterium stanieri LEGE 03274]